ncbi:Cytochrome P460 [Dyadobacter koreensis]|uniref:Cytochrome P460 n=1 Tax=Dyadobacter koreensis TaxID=408657 RepID=A0A1H6UIW3_9BACT|nr:heme-binding domain-containing protein [Dyadobacter koreensis]SEI92238.1 Cytochrome P460 [Dyadobacter koreensis]
MNFSKPTTYRKTVVILSSVVFASLVALQITGPTISNPQAKGKFHAPAEVLSIFERSCYDCHSNETDLRWYDKIAPFSYVVAADVNEARKRFNFSEWDTLSKSDQETKLWYMINMIDAGKMPLATYTSVHPESKVSKADLDVLKNYVIKLSNQNHSLGDTSRIKLADKTYKNSQDTGVGKTPKSINGISYFDDYKNWKIISSTNRFDNGTMRLIYGNEIAINAIKEDKIKPWPNGAILVKVVWNSQKEDNDGNIKPGNFNNVQMMIRDDKRFKDTEGWGFARFSGLSLEPYGKTISFATSCINCHRLVPDNGFVFDIPSKNLKH